MRVVMDTADLLGPLQKALSRKGRGRVIIVSPLGDNQQVEIDLNRGYAISPETLRAVRAMPGVAAVEEI